jgi:hypothetical protein
MGTTLIVRSEKLQTLNNLKEGDFFFHGGILFRNMDDNHFNGTLPESPFTLVFDEQNGRVVALSRDVEVKKLSTVTITYI